MSLLKTNTTKDYSKPKCVKNAYGGGRKLRKLNIQKPSKYNIRNLFKLKEENEAIKDRIIRDITTLFEQEDYYKPVRVDNFYSNNYIKYGNNANKNKTLLIKDYFNKVKPYLKTL